MVLNRVLICFKCWFETLRIPEYGIRRAIRSWEPCRIYSVIALAPNTPAAAEITAITNFRIMSHTDFLIAIVSHLLSCSFFSDFILRRIRVLSSPQSTDIPLSIPPVLSPRSRSGPD